MIQSRQNQIPTPTVPSLVRGALLAFAGICGGVVAWSGPIVPVAASAAATLPRDSKAPNASASVKPETSGDWRARHSLYYKRNWGIEVVGVKPVSSGYMLDFRYRIVDPLKAAVLHDQKSKAYLRDDATGTMLAVPAMENIGELRTGATPEVGRTYFMIFGNPGKLVKPGSRVSILVGNLHIDDLIVD